VREGLVNRKNQTAPSVGMEDIQHPAAA